MIAPSLIPLAQRIAGVRQRVKGNRLALTFDDGPDPEFTPQILEALARADVRATFFVVGWRAEAFPEVVRMTATEGHAIGSHTMSHRDLWELGLGQLRAEIAGGRTAVERVLGRPVSLFRPPKGYVDLPGAAIVRSSRLNSWLWSIDPEDWMPGRTLDDILDGVQGLCDGDVMLLHDSVEQPESAVALDRKATVTAIAGIVDLARGRGLTPVAL